RYEVVIDYTCPLADVGSTVELSFQSAAIQGIVQPGWDPPLYTNQDTLPRPPAESSMKEFRPLSLGMIELPKGAGQLTLRALEIPGRSVMDVRRLTLTLQSDAADSDAADSDQAANGDDRPNVLWRSEERRVGKEW